MTAMHGRRLAILGLGFALLGCDSLVSPSRYGEVVVHAVRRDGVTPVPGVRVVLYTGARPMSYEATGPDGMVRFRDVPEGSYGVLAQPGSGYEFQASLLGGPKEDTYSGLPVRADSAISVRFTLLKKGPGAVTVLVQDDQGAPLRGHLVELYDQFAVHDSVVSGPDGLARFTDVPYGNYGVFVERTPGIREAGVPTTEFRDALVVEEGSDTTVVVPLALCRGTLRMRVADPERGGVAGARLVLYTGRAVLDSMTTDAQGNATFSVICAPDYGVRISHAVGWLREPEPGSAYIDGIAVTRDAVVDAQLSVRYDPCRWTLAASVTDAGGAPVSGATLDLYVGSGPIERRTLSGSSTSFESLPCSGNFGLRITSPPGWTATPGRGSDFFDGIEGTEGGTVSLRFVLRRP